MIELETLRLFLIALIATTLGELVAEAIRKQAPRLIRWIRKKREGGGFGSRHIERFYQKGAAMNAAMVFAAFFLAALVIGLARSRKE